MLHKHTIANNSENRTKPIKVATILAKSRVLILKQVELRSNMVTEKFKCLRYFIYGNMLTFYPDKFLEPRPINELEDNTLSAVRRRQLNILTITLHMWRMSLHQHKGTEAVKKRDQFSIL
jgi:hypothetical protein